MFSIIISEKGGAERKETFDKNEINVGRVQGNDLMLPKGNVSKHHARLLFRDGRFIVTDLKSTNGTYVNGRKIAQATIVREGDKIYIGDFVLRLDAAAVVAGADAAGPSEEESIRTLSRGNNGPNAPPGGPPGAMQVGPMGPPMGGPPMGAVPMGGGMAGGGMQMQMGPQVVNTSPNPPAPTMKAPTHPPAGGPAVARQALAPPQPQPGLAPRSDPGAVSHFPLERDPDDSESSPDRLGLGGGVPAPIAAPSGAPRATPGKSPSGAPPGGPVLTRSGPPGAGPRMPTAVSPQGANNRPPAGAAPARAAPPKDTAAQAGRRLALITLVDRIADAVDLRGLKTSPLVDDVLAQQIDRTAREQANAMRDEGEAPEGTDVEALVRDAVRELVGLGPIGMLLEDEEVAEIHCMRHDQVLAMRGGQMGLADSSFTSEDALFRVIARLVHQSGEAWRAGEFVVERRLPRGAQMLAVVPPASTSHVLVIRRKRRVDTSLEELVRAGALSRPMAQVLEQALVVRANVLVVGPPPGAVTFAAGLAGSVAPGERISVVHDVDEVNVSHAHMVALPLTGNVARDEETVRAAAKLHPDRLVIASLSVGAASATIEAIAEGAEGVIVAAQAPSLRQGLARFVARLVLARAGLGADGAREAIGEAFDLAVEVTVTGDGRQRVTRISELAGTDAKGFVVRDVFTSESDGNFTATGLVPRLASELAARGIRLDPALFKKGR